MEVFWSTLLYLLFGSLRSCLFSCSTRCHDGAILVTFLYLFPLRFLQCLYAMDIMLYDADSALLCVCLFEIFSLFRNTSFDNIAHLSGMLWGFEYRKVQVALHDPYDV